VVERRLFQIPKLPNEQPAERKILISAPTIAAPNAGIKIRLIIQRFQAALGRNGQNALQQSQ